MLVRATYPAALVRSQQMRFSGCRVAELRSLGPPRCLRATTPLLLLKAHSALKRDTRCPGARRESTITADHRPLDDLFFCHEVRFPTSTTTTPALEGLLLCADYRAAASTGRAYHDPG